MKYTEEEAEALLELMGLHWHWSRDYGVRLYTYSNPAHYADVVMFKSPTKQQALNLAVEHYAECK